MADKIECLYAHTPATGYTNYPPYINLSFVDGKYVLTVRHKEIVQDHMAFCGETASIEMTEDQLMKLADAIIGHIENG
jgi:hypothetical protein